METYIREAEVQSLKYNLKRTVRNVNLTFKELLTLVNQIEAVLNSRPTTHMSADANDLKALTPGHFLVGRPHTAIPERELIDKRDFFYRNGKNANKLCTCTLLHKLLPYVPAPDWPKLLLHSV